ncbi:maltose ABC transporter ATP binding subunit [Burkholderia multivorans]
MAHIQLHRLSKFFAGQQVLHDIDLDIRDGEFIALVGPSGCGKSTLLRCVAGLERIDGGGILFDGRPVHDLPPQKRQLAMVFQSYALYPHMTVFDNMAFGLRERGEPEARVRERVNRAAAVLHLDNVLARYPGSLSGGQRQRVAMGRAMVREPVAFLFDEPLSNLDAQLRVQMRAEIRDLQRDLGVTTIYVTHDQEEAMTMADRVVVLRAGRLEQADAPLALYDRPANDFVARFIGSPPMNLLPLQWDAHRAVVARQAVEGAAVPAADGRHEAAALGIRPEHLSVAAPGAAVDGADGPALAGHVHAVDQLGSLSEIRVRLGPPQGGGDDACDVLARVPGRQFVKQGEPVVVGWRWPDAHFFDAGGKRL